MLTRQKIAGGVAAGLMGVGFLLMMKAVLHQGPLADEVPAETSAVRPEAGAMEWTTPPAGAPVPRRERIELTTDSREDALAPLRGDLMPAEEEPSAPSPAEEPEEPPPTAERAIVYEQAPAEVPVIRPPAESQPVKPASAVKVHKVEPKTMSVAEAKLCLGVKDRTPQKAGTTFAASAAKVYCWVRIANGEKRKVRMLWRLGKAESTGEWLEIGSPWWRTWSYKTLPKGFKGDASVSIVDESGAVLK
ncbi:MAG: DUF2914 domain-containing protein, partial [Planctomycetota bacterium]